MKKMAPTVSYTSITKASRKGLIQSVVLAVFLGTAAFSLAGFFLQNNPNQLIVAVIALYLAIECSVYLQRSDAFGLLAPPLIASFAHFFLAYLLPTAATLVDPWIQARFDVYFRSFEEDISKALLIAGGGAFCMWRGYYVGRGPAQRLRARIERSPALRKEFEPNLLATYAIQALYFATVSYAVALGVFGITSSAKTREANLALLDILNLGFAAGSLSFLLLLTHLFRKIAAGEPVVALKAVCIGIVALHLMVGAISGFKSQLVMPFVMIVLAKFLVTKKIGWRYVLAGIVAMFIAYQVIEPYRSYLGRESAQGASDAGSLINALQESYAQRDIGQQSEVPLGTQITQRFDLTAMSAIGIAFTDSSPLAVEKGAELAETLYLAPLLAFVPRALWTEKSTYSTGGWFNTVVLGSSNETAVGMGPTTWLYMVGGLAGVAVGFFCLGWLQAIMFDGLARAGAGGVVVFLAGANSLITIPTDIGPVLVGLLRLLPFAFLAQYLLLRPTRKRRS